VIRSPGAVPAGALPVSPAALAYPCSSQLAHQQHHDQHHHDQADNAAGPVAPASAVPPCGQHPEKNQYQYDQRNRAYAHENLPKLKTKKRKVIVVGPRKVVCALAHTDAQAVAARNANPRALSAGGAMGRRCVSARVGVSLALANRIPVVQLAAGVVSFYERVGLQAAQDDHLQFRATSSAPCVIVKRCKSVKPTASGEPCPPIRDHPLHLPERRRHRRVLPFLSHPHPPQSAFRGFRRRWSG